MKKTFCDCCDQPITSENSSGGAGDLVRFTVADVKFHITPSGLGAPTPMDYDVCKYCLIDAVKQLDDRPTHVPVEMHEGVSFLFLGFMSPDKVVTPYTVEGGRAVYVRESAT